MRILFLLLTFILPYAAIAEPNPADAIFLPTVQVANPHTLQVHFMVAPGGNLYQQKIRAQINPDHAASIASIHLPKTTYSKPGPDGEPHPAYQHSFTLTLKLKNITNDSFHLKLHYQGCSDAGICYPPQNKTYAINLSPPYHKTIQPMAAPEQISATSQNQQSKFILVLSYFLTGLLMAFTPCVLPMLPIVAGIVIRKHHQSSRKGIFLAISYVLGMALCYSIGGIFVAAAGANVAAFWQQPWLIALFSAVFVILALSLFGLFHVNLPHKWQGTLTQLSNQKNSGRILGAFIMGGLSSLILSPCITPALLGGLAYIAQSGDVVTGGFALFAMGIGMGVPLLLIGWLGPELFGRIHQALNAVKQLLGVLMLAVALLLLSRIIPLSLTQIAWGLLFLGAGAVIFFMDTGKNTLGKWVRYILSFALGLYGLGLWYQVARFPARSSLPILTLTHQHKKHIPSIASLTELNTTLATQAKHYTLMRVTAKWCISCQIIDHNVLSNTAVRQKLANIKQIQLDLTNYTPEKSAIAKHYHIIGPPSFILFYNTKQAGTVLSGEVSKASFLKWLKKNQNSVKKNLQA